MAMQRILEHSYLHFFFFNGAVEQRKTYNTANYAPIYKKNSFKIVF